MLLRYPKSDANWAAPEVERVRIDGRTVLVRWERSESESDESHADETASGVSSGAAAVVEEMAEDADPEVELEDEDKVADTIVESADVE